MASYTGRAALTMAGLTRRFASASGSVLALDDVTADIRAGSLTVVAGPSGSGKSTLLAIAACVDRPDTGTVRLNGTDVLAIGRRARRSMRRTQLGLILPQPAENLLDSMDAAGNLRWAARRRTGTPPADADLRSVMAGVGLDFDAVRSKTVRALSGGEQQRLALASVLIGAPTVVLADEPTASLDRASAALVVDALRAAADRAVTLLVASHDRHVLEAADVVIHLDHGRRVA